MALSTKVTPCPGPTAGGGAGSAAKLLPSFYSSCVSDTKGKPRERLHRERRKTDDVMTVRAKLGTFPHLWP